MYDTIDNRALSELQLPLARPREIYRPVPAVTPILALATPRALSPTRLRALVAGLRSARRISAWRQWGRFCDLHFDGHHSSVARYHAGVRSY